MARKSDRTTDLVWWQGDGAAAPGAGVLSLGGHAFMTGSAAPADPQRQDQDDWLCPSAALVPALHGYHPVAQTSPGASHMAVDLRVTDPAGRPIAGAEVCLFSTTQDGGDLQRTDHHGRAVLYIAAEGSAVARLVIEAKGFWGLTLTAPRLLPVTSILSQSNLVTLTPISGAAVDSPCWGLEAMGLDRAPQGSALGLAPVRVAVATCAQLTGPEHGFRPCAEMTMPDDSMVSDWRPEPRLQPDLTLSEPFLALIAETVLQAAPGAIVQPLLLPRQPRVSDVIRLLDHCLRARVDMLCLCLAAPRANRALARALHLARQAGLLVLVPAHDDTGAVNRIAGLGQSLGVAAVGHVATVPPMCPHHRLMDRQAGAALAPMAGASESAAIALVAPGLAVQPQRSLHSGAAFAAAYAAGFAARLLQAAPQIAKLPRSGVRPAALHKAVLSHCIDAGLGSASVQGAGLPVWDGRGSAYLSPHQEQHLAEAAQSTLDRISMAQKA